MHAALPLRFTCTLPRRCMQVFVVLLHLGGNVGGKDGLQPLSGAAATNPRMGGKTVRSPLDTAAERNIIPLRKLA